MSAQYIVLLIGLGLFFILSGIEIYFGFIEDEKNRKRWKVFPTLVLGLTLGIAFYNHPYVYIALLLGFIGDLLLIWEYNDISFIAGSLCFFIGHIFYTIEMVIDNNANFPWYFFVSLVAAWLIFLLILFLTLRKKLKKIYVLFGASFYFIILFINLAITIILGVNNANNYLFICSAGYVLFILSDTLLSYKLFFKEFKMDDFYIMFTYLLAQLLISIGLVLPFLK